MSHNVFDDEYDPLAPASVDVPDEDDPLAPPDYGGSEPEPFEEEGDGGFSDGDHIVRVWLEDGRLSKVRLSPVWFHKVTGTDTLENHFAQALSLAGLMVAPTPPEPAEMAEPQFATELPAEPEDMLADVPAEAKRAFNGLPHLNKVSMAAFDVLFQDHEQRMAEAARRVAEHPVQKAPRVSGKSKGVTVHLNESGRAIAVSFDQAWLDEAQVGSICSNVMLAAERAYDRYVPVEAPPNELDDLRQEGDLLHAAYLAMLSPRRDYR